jgi:hypothetical protein
MSTQPFDPSGYTRAPNLTIATALTLATTLVSACPKGAPPNAKKACKKLQTVAASAQAAWTDRKRELGATTEGGDPLLDQEADTSWSALRMRLQAYAMLPADRYPLAARAAAILVVLFGAEGLEFLKSAYVAQVATMATILKLIDDDQLQAEIDEIAGAEFLGQIRHVQPRYDAMVKAMLKKDAASGQNLLEHVRAVQRAIVDYATKICATVDEDDEETIVSARDALRPIDNHREAQAQRTSAGAAPATPAPPAEGPKP